jgi:hypothetical protein
MARYLELQMMVGLRLTGYPTFDFRRGNRSHGDDRTGWFFLTSGVAEGAGESPVSAQEVERLAGFITNSSE